MIIRPPPGSPAALAFENAFGRISKSLHHTWRLEDRLVVSGGSPPLELLDGDAISGRGGRSRHGVEAQVGVFKRELL